MRLALLCVLAVLSIPFSSEAQAVRYDWFASTTSAQCQSGRQCPINALPGTQVNICGGAVTTLSSCLASPATTYTDASAGTPCPTTAQLTPATGGSCVAYADAQGGYGFWILPGSYNYFLRVPTTAGGGTYGPYPLAIGASAGCILGVVCDASYSTLGAADTAAGTGSLEVTRNWNSLSTQTLNSHTIWNSAGAKIQPASGQTVTLTNCPQAGPFQIFDLSLGGTVALPGGCQYGTPFSWWGSDASAMGSALAASRWVTVPAGAYTFSSSVSFTVTGTRLTCASNGGSVITFSGATDGFVFPSGSTGDNIQMENCQILTSNASGGKALNEQGGGAGHDVFSNVLISQSGSGAWTYGLYTGDWESSAVYSLRCYNVAVCVYLGANANGNAFYGTEIGGGYATGFQTSGVEDVSIFGGVIQGGATSYLVNSSNGLKIYGTHLENHGAVPFVYCGGVCVIDGVELSGSGSDILYSAGVQDFKVGHITGSVSASSSIIRADGGSFAPGTVSIHDSVIINNTTTGNAILLGTSGGTGGLKWNVSRNRIQAGSASGKGIVLNDIESPTISDNYISAGSYGIDTSAGTSVDITWTGNNFLVADVAHICNGCTTGLSTAVQFGNYFHGVGLQNPNYENAWFKSAQVDGLANTMRPYYISTSTSLRWAIYGDNTTESGANDGTYLNIDRYNDDGVTHSTAIQVKRNGAGIYLNDLVNVGFGATTNAMNFSSAITVAAGVSGCPTLTPTNAGCLQFKRNGSTINVPYY